VSVAGPPQLLYLEPDDEITTVVRRLRETNAERIVLVASGRTKATSSAVALRLLAGVAADEGRQVALVADAAARAMAAEAGIDTFASVAEASADGAVPLAPPEPRRAPIRVVRDADPARPLAAVVSSAPGLDETQAVPVSRPALGEAPEATQARSRRFAVGVAAALALIAIAGLAAVLPAATVRITAAARAIGPLSYTLELPIEEVEEIDIEVTQEGTAGGESIELVVAGGVVTFFNWNTVQVEVPGGTVVSVDGGTAFTTAETIRVGPGQFTPDGRVQAGQADVGVTAADPGPGGNVAAGAIDTIENAFLRAVLRGFPNNPEALIVNAAPTTGGAEITHPVIRQEDVDAVATAVRTEIAAEVAEATETDPERVYAAVEIGEPAIEVPDGLVGTQDQETFELIGRLSFERAYVLAEDVDEAAGRAIRGDPSATPQGMTLDVGSAEADIGDAQRGGGRIEVPVMVRASAIAQLDAAVVRDSVLGLTRDEAEAALDGVGSVDVELWPGWVDRIPRLDWRVTVEIAGESPSP